VDALLVLVDAENVRRSRWPNLRDDQLVELVRAWAEREGVAVLIVFDGTAPGGRTGEWALDECTRVVGTGRGTADDWIAEHAPRLAGEGRPLWLVTSDRELRRRVAPFVARTIGGGSFAGELQSLERERGT
jgi:predicted RNA-binding protein with PIN domain